MAARMIGWWLTNPFKSIGRIENIRLIYKITFKTYFMQTCVPLYVQTKSFGILSNTSLQLDQHNLNYCVTRRWKHDKRQKTRRRRDDDDDDDDINSIDEDTQALVAGNRNAKVLCTNIPSMRVDAVIKAGTGMARNKAETTLYGSKLRINGEKVTKKSQQIKIDDMIDIVQGTSPKNPNFLIVTRLTVQHACLTDAGYRIKLLREKGLTIENYEDSWTPATDLEL